MNEGLPVSDSPMGMSLEDCLDCFNGAGRVPPTTDNIIPQSQISDGIKVDEITKQQS